MVAGLLQMGIENGMVCRGAAVAVRGVGRLGEERVRVFALLARSCQGHGRSPNGILGHAPLARSVTMSGVGSLMAVLRPNILIPPLPTNVETRA